MSKTPSNSPGKSLGKSHGRLSISATAAPRELMGGPPPLAEAWEARVITLFPEAFPGTLGLSLLGKALDAGLWRLSVTDLRNFGEGKHRNVDDTPAGGGAGMVLRADVLARALEHAMRDAPPRADWPVYYLSPRGKPFDQAAAKTLSETRGVTLICGRFEGVDQRVLDHFGIEEISIGDYVLSGGEIAAQTVLDAALRLRPGVLGNAASIEEESFSDGLLEHPHYTRPAVWEGHEIPAVLTSGDHGAVAKWRRDEALRLTHARRPDLIRAKGSDDAD
jgi:tRNA (guanine37-N1)-methyltransferase